MLGHNISNEYEVSLPTSGASNFNGIMISNKIF